TQHATAPLVAARDAFAGAPAPTLTFDASLVFRTQPMLDAVFGMAERATDGPRTGLERWGNDNPTGMAHDHVGVLATGTTTILRFRRAAPGRGGSDPGDVHPARRAAAARRLPGGHLRPRPRRRPRSAALVR